MCKYLLHWAYTSLIESIADDIDKHSQLRRFIFWVLTHDFQKLCVDKSSVIYRLSQSAQRAIACLRVPRTDDDKTWKWNSVTAFVWRFPHRLSSRQISLHFTVSHFFVVAFSWRIESTDPVKPPQLSISGPTRWRTHVDASTWGPYRLLLSLLIDWYERQPQQLTLRYEWYVLSWHVWH